MRKMILTVFSAFALLFGAVAPGWGETLQAFMAIQGSPTTHLVILFHPEDDDVILESTGKISCGARGNGNRTLYNAYLQMEQDGGGDIPMITWWFDNVCRMANGVLLARVCFSFPARSPICNSYTIQKIGGKRN